MIEDEEGPVSAGREPKTSAENADGQSLGESRGQGAPSGVNAMTGADFQVYIGKGLRAVFDDVANQPIPDRFLELMKKLG